MVEKVAELEKKFRQLEAELSQPELYADMERAAVMEP